MIECERGMNKLNAKAIVSLCHRPCSPLTHWGVEMARKGGVPANRVLNYLSLRQITRHFSRRGREQARAACRASALKISKLKRKSPVVPENSIRRDSRGEAESAPHPRRCLRSSTCLQRL
jgi:hypothetical protein